MIKCSSCNEIYHENADYCPNCGTVKMNVEEFFITIRETSRPLEDRAEIIVYEEENTYEHYE